MDICEFRELVKAHYAELEEEELKKVREFRESQERDRLFFYLGE